MKTEFMNAHDSINTDAVSLEGFIVKETLATGPFEHNRGRQAAKNNFCRAELSNIQKKRRRVSGRLYRRYL